MLRRKKPTMTVMGLAIELNSANAKAVAADLAQLQLGVFMSTKTAHFLDQNPHPGHLNYEINKFGYAVQQAIKDDLRKNPSDKRLLEFYVDLLDACLKLNNYELSSRVYAGIDTAIMLDQGIELGQEDEKTKHARVLLKSELQNIKKWQKLRDTKFPGYQSAPALFRTHMKKRQVFVPSHDAFIVIMDRRVDSARDCYIAGDSLPAVKAERMMGIMQETKADLDFIQEMMDYLREKIKKQDKLHFNQLRERFAELLNVNLEAPRENLDFILKEVLKINAMVNQMPRAETIAIAVPKLHISPRGQVKQRTPRQTVDSESFVGSPRSESALSPRYEGVISARSEGRFSPRLFPVSDDSSYANEGMGSSLSEDLFTPPVSPGRAELISPRVRSLRGDK